MVGGKGGLEEVLPEEVGGRGDQGEEGVLEDGDPVDCEGGLVGMLGFWGVGGDAEFWKAWGGPTSL